MDVTVQTVTSAFTEIFTVEAVRYLIAIGLVAAAIAFIARKSTSRNLHQNPPSREQLWREFSYSMLTCAVFAANGLYIYFGIENGYVLIYDDPADYGAIYWVFSLAAIVIAHDAWFYWTHRFLHHPKIFNWAHRLHHKSKEPTAWAAYAFTPMEAFINGSLVPIWVTLVPMNGWAIFIFLAHMILRNAMGHSGYELFPRYMPGNKYFGFITNVFHHDLHHRDVERGNYGLYFVWWDRWMGTEHPDYAKLVARQRQKQRELPAT